MKNITEIGETKPSLKERYQNVTLFIIQTFHQLRMSTALHVEFCSWWRNTFFVMALYTWIKYSNRLP